MSSTGNTPTHSWAALHLEREKRWIVARGGLSPLIDLVHWVCAERPEFSRLFLRAPICLPQKTALTPTEQMAVRVFAKRTRELPEVPEGAEAIAGAPFAFANDVSLPLAFESDSAIAQWLSTQTSYLKNTALGRTRPILALALNSAREVLGVARARGGERRDAHAEWILWDSLTEELRAQVAHVWVSLKPCRFCATLVYPRSVTYLEFDPGPLGRETVLDAHSPDRRRFYPQDSEQREIQFQV